MRLTQFFLLVTMVVFSSCSNREFYQTYTTKVDSLDATLEASASSYESIDTVLIKNQYKLINQNTDSLNGFPELALDPLVVQYRYVQKKYKTFFRGHTLNLNELKYSRQQLIDLKHDFEKRQFETDSALKYFNQEQEAVTIIKKRMDSYQKLIQEGEQGFDQLNPEIEILLDSLSKSEQIENITL